MFIKEFLKQFDNNKIKIFVDMDGVIADYDFNKPNNYHLKRPLYESIKKLELLSNEENIELYILSITRKTEGYEQKNEWLDKYAPFFKKENRVIISREENNMLESSKLKSNYLKQYKRDGSVIVVIDDDPINLKEIHNSNNDIILLKDSALID